MPGDGSKQILGFQPSIVFEVLWLIVHGESPVFVPQLALLSVFMAI